MVQFNLCLLIHFKKFLHFPLFSDIFDIFLRQRLQFSVKTLSSIIGKTALDNKPLEAAVAIKWKNLQGVLKSIFKTYGNIHVLLNTLSNTRRPQC